MSQSAQWKLQMSEALHSTLLPRRHLIARERGQDQMILSAAPSLHPGATVNPRPAVDTPYKCKTTCTGMRRHFHRKKSTPLRGWSKTGDSNPYSEHDVVFIFYTTKEIGAPLITIYLFVRVITPHIQMSQDPSNRFHLKRGEVFTTTMHSLSWTVKLYICHI